MEEDSTGIICMWLQFRIKCGIVYMKGNDDCFMILVTGTKWTVGVANDGYFIFRNTNADMRYLACNGTGFKAYPAATDVRIIKLLLIPVTE